MLKRHGTRPLSLLARAAFVLFVALSTQAQFALARPLQNLATYDDPASPPIGYSGAGWFHTTMPNTILGTISWTSQVNDTVQLTFTGSSITRLYSMASNRGSEEVYIDGSLVSASTSSYAPETRRQIGTTWTFPDGTHTIQVKAKGGGGGFSDLDAFASDIQRVGTGIYDDNDAQFRWIGSYFATPVACNCPAYQGTLHYSNVAGEGFRFTFVGDTITWVYSTAYNRGKAAVTIDGTDYGYVDLYSAAVVRQVTKNFTNLGSGVHIINIMVSGQKNALSSDTFVDVDALIPATTSRYVANTNLTAMYTLGCVQGIGLGNSAGVAVLDFGQPWLSGGTYGAVLIGGAFQSVTTIENAAKSYLNGVWDCSTSGAYLNFGIGTSTVGSTYVTNAHGQAWATMVHNVNSWIAANSRTSKLRAVGANDIENGSPWSPAANAIAWANGFDAINPDIYYNYGSCAGCPSSLNPTWVPNGGFTTDNFYQLSWGIAAAYPLPEIYNTGGVNGAQWQWVAQYGVTNYSQLMSFKGAMTEYEACWGPPVRSCSGIDNTPGAGWLQLYYWLNTAGATAQTPPYITDITWQW